ncbi:hypothetical protein DFH08DRAFT_710016, partial [Mycena albidolilacea]
TQTVPARDVFHNVQSAICPLIAGIQTQEQVTDLIQSLETLQYSQKLQEAQQEQIRNPSAISHEGRPRTARITNAREGQQRGGGVTRATRTNVEVASEPASPSAPKKSRVGRSYKCSLCRQGHNRLNCPLGPQNISVQLSDILLSQAWQLCLA